MKYEDFQTALCLNEEIETFERTLATVMDLIKGGVNPNRKSIKLILSGHEIRVPVHLYKLLLLDIEKNIAAELKSWEDTFEDL